MELNIYDHSFHNEKLKKNLSWNGEKLNYLLETKKIEFRKKYTQIIYTLIKNISSEHKSFTYKYVNLVKMSLINEKNPFKSKNIYDCLKLIALEDFIRKNKVKKILYHGNNCNLDKSIHVLCKNLKLNYKRKKILINFDLKLIYFFKGLIFFFIQIYKNFFLKKNSKKYFSFSIFSYFVHFNKINSSKFNSNLWGNLIKNLNKNKIKINWFHFFIPSGQIKNKNEANYILKKFNYNKLENHNFINSYLSLKSLFCILLSYIYFFTKNFFFLREKRFFFNMNSKVNLYFFLKKDFLNSFFGYVLIYNMTHISRFDNLLKKIPKQKFGLFIIENQSWEYCLNVLWRKYNHGKLIGYINSSIRFWDLRYQKVQNELTKYGETLDFYLANSQIAKNELKKIGYPKKKIFLAEALRYQKLKPSRQLKNKKLLIVGDILFDETLDMLNFIKNSIPYLRNYTFNFKPHPTMTFANISEIKRKYYFIKIVNVNSDKFKNFEFIICSNGTSAILDCIIQKLNFCSIRFLNRLNLFPFESKQNLFQVTNTHELVSKIKYKKRLNQYNPFEKKKSMYKFLSDLV